MQMERQLRAGGGIMTLDEPRQGYFLGKIVKKAKRAVKKITKSPIGKLALAATAANFAPMLLGKQTLLQQAGGFGGLGSFLGGKISSAFKPGSFLSPLVRADKGMGALSAGKLGLLGLGGAAIAAPFFMGGDEEEVVEEAPFSETPSTISDIVEQARRQDASLRFLPKPKFVDNFYLADGGLASIRPGYKEGESVLSEEQMAMISDMKNKGMDMSTIESMTGATADQITNYLSSLNQKQEGGLMDLGGFEKDYREGGFVPLGAEERADDVPARLSKNEFVFTADAVRNAGGGDIDEGARVMQNMMDNLEAGGTISEESQGMNPAQEMFDQAQMMESRLA